MTPFLGYILAATVMVAASVPAQTANTRLAWIPNPRTSSGSWVADPAHHLQPYTVAAIDSAISKLERETSVEIAVVVADSLDGLEPADAALLLHRRWGVGKRQRDNGIVFLWSPALRKIYVSVGYGLEGVLPDARVGRIEDNSVLPFFRQGDFDNGMLAGTTALASAAREETAWRPEGIAPGRPTSPARSSGPGPFALFLLGLLGGALLLAMAMVVGRVRRYWPRRCPNGHGRMRLLTEAEDDAQLSREEGLEERLGSMDYDVWVCRQCDARIVTAHRRVFTRYGECPQCKRRTLETTASLVRSATTASTAVKRERRSCRNCDFHDEREVVIPLVVASSGGRSGGSSFGGGSHGGGSSFGGGSAGGGGAGRSY